MSDLRGKSVSILLDSCKKLARNFQGVVIFTPKRLYFYKIFGTSNSKAITLNELVNMIIEKFYQNNTQIIYICTDNCNANRTAFDEIYFLGRHILRESCSSHTGNLAIHDMFIDGEYQFVYTDMIILLQNIPPELCHNGIPPKFITIRWKSMFTCVNYICNHFTNFRNSNNIYVKNALNNIEYKIDWNNLLKMLHIMWNFVCQTERDLASIADIVQPFLVETNDATAASKKTRQSSPISISKNCPFQLPFFSYLLTQNGLQYFRDDQRGIENFNNFKLTINQYMIERRLSINDITLINSVF